MHRIIALVKNNILKLRFHSSLSREGRRSSTSLINTAGHVLTRAVSLHPCDTSGQIYYSHGNTAV